MNVLGVIFDNKLNWSAQVLNSIQKENKALHAIRLIKQNFSKNELRMLITSNFYSIIFYNSEIWHIPTLQRHLKVKLKSASANALKICTPNYNRFMSYSDIHLLNNRALPSKIMIYKHAIILHRLVSNEIPSIEWVALHFNLILSSRMVNFKVIQNFNYKIGQNILTNRLSIVNGLIPLNWLNKSYESFKYLCKKQFL